MKLKLSCRRSPIALLVLLALVGAGAGVSQAEPLPFRRAVQLAVSRAALLGTAPASELEARASYNAAHDAYLPQMVLGSGLGWTYGYPMSIEGAAPSIFNVNYQSTVFSLAQRDYIRSAKVAWDAAQSTAKNERSNLMLETAVTYVQLCRLADRLHNLNGELGDASRLVSITQARYEAGVTSNLAVTQAELAQARARMELAQVSGTVAVLRERLAQLTGIAADAIKLESDSIPEMPPVGQQSELVAQALASSAALKAAEQQTIAKQLQARGDHKQLYPSVDAAAQYGVFSKFNNFDQFFSKFQRNNATVGLGIRFPILNYAQRAQLGAADAEALMAQRQAQLVRNQVSTQTIQLAEAVQQLTAAEQVSQLEYQVAQAQVEATQARAESQAPGAPGAPPATPQELENARIEAGQRYSAYVDAGFELQKARLQLLSVTGELENWVAGTP